MPVGVPFLAGGRASVWIAGTFASVAVVAAALRAQRAGHGEHIDGSGWEVMTLAAHSYGA
jgi:crotonobetainyl-CoA:carnitine CoA-transferase CaiB-like acyl-CoA transferase